MSEANANPAQLLAQFQAYEAEARAVAAPAHKQPVLPMADYVKETRSVTEYARTLWERGPDNAPALKVGRAKFSAERLDRLASLLDGLQYAHLLEVSELRPAGEIGQKVARAQFLMDELEDALSFLLDDDVQEPADKRLDAVQAATASAGARGASVGHVLLAWGLFARDELARLSTLDDFNPALIDEAFSLGADLTAAHPMTPARRSELRALRLGFFTLVYAEVQALRTAASYVYRRHPDLKKKFTSALERNRRNQKRLEQRLADKLSQATASDPTPAP